MHFTFFIQHSPDGFTKIVTGAGLFSCMLTYPISGVHFDTGQITEIKEIFLSVLLWIVYFVSWLLYVIVSLSVVHRYETTT